MKKISSMFLDPSRPLFTCSATSCAGCPVSSKLHCHFNGRDLGRFLLVAIPPFIAGGAGIVRFGWYWLIPWVSFALAYFGMIEIRVMCSHCPHYAEPGTSTLKCWANYGSPKLWKYRPGPLSRMEKFVFFAGLVLIVAYPLAFLVFGVQLLLLGLFILLVIGVGSVMAGQMCANCMNFACPLNSVSPAVRQAFFERNPIIAQAWKDKYVSN